MDPAQGESTLSEDDWSAYLTEALQNPVVVKFGRARRQVVQSKGYWKDPRGKPVEVRLAGFFRDAPPEVQATLATWLRPGRRSRRAATELDAFIERSLRALPPKKRRADPVDPKGLTRDLGPLVHELVEGPSAEFELLDFAPRGLPAVGWGRRGRSRARRSLQLGSYSEDSHRVRLHPVLDQSAVPVFFLRYVVFHELLHAVHSITGELDESKRARRLHHDKRFRAREANYRDFAAAGTWQKRNISGLLRSARSGKSLRAK